jgi:hypothetical protein
MPTPPLEIRAQPLKELFDYWDRKRGERFAPTPAAIVPTEIKPLLRRLFIVEVVGSPPRFRFRLAGTAVVDGFGEELTGRFLDELDLAKRHNEIARDYHQVLATRAPACSRWHYTKQDGKPQRYERLLMPLSAEAPRST